MHMEGRAMSHPLHQDHDPSRHHHHHYRPGEQKKHLQVVGQQQQRRAADEEVKEEEEEEQEEEERRRRKRMKAGLRHRESGEEEVAKTEQEHDPGSVDPANGGSGGKAPSCNLCRQSHTACEGYDPPHIYSLFIF